jgi:hypothetical protein
MPNPKESKRTLKNRREQKGTEWNMHFIFLKGPVPSFILLPRRSEGGSLVENHCKFAKIIANRGQSWQKRSAGFPALRVHGTFQSRVRELATGKSPEPADRNVCATWETSSIRANQGESSRIKVKNWDRWLGQTRHPLWRRPTAPPAHCSHESHRICQSPLTSVRVNPSKSESGNSQGLSDIVSSSRGKIVARASSPASSGGVSPRESSPRAGPRSLVTPCLTEDGKSNTKSAAANCQPTNSLLH